MIRSAKVRDNKRAGNIRISKNEDEMVAHWPDYCRSEVGHMQKQEVVTDPCSNVDGVCLLCDVGITAVEAAHSCSIGQWGKHDLRVICSRV